MSRPNILKSRAGILRSAAFRLNVSNLTVRWKSPRGSVCAGVSTGSTLKANGLVEIEEIATVTSQLVVNRAALKTRSAEIHGWIDRFREALDAA